MSPHMGDGSGPGWSLLRIEQLVKVVPGYYSDGRHSGTPVGYRLGH